MEQFLKTKILEFHAAGAEPDQTVAWLIVAAPNIIAQIAQFELPAVTAWLQADPILNPLSQPTAKKWVDGFLKAAKLAVESAK